MDARIAKAIQWHRPLMLFSLAMVGVAAVSLLGLVVDDRMLVDAPIWLKPFKFAVSFILYSVTWAWLMSMHPRRPRWLHHTGSVLVAAGVVEMVIISGQALRGKRSHFNVETGFDSILFSVMGLTVVILWVATLVASISLARTRYAPRSLTVAINLGMATSLAGMLVGAVMSSQQTGIDGTAGAHSIGAADGGPIMPITGWSTVAGDLRVGHFVGLHAVQALPLIALLVTVLATRYAILADERVRTRLAWTAGGVYIGLFVLVTWQAFRGQPLIQPDALTLLAFAAIVAGGLAGIAWARAAHTEVRETVAA
ncbi:MAG TPA: hypothetical protein VM677_04685 [Actinokineospora sp.]|nr:hypothetical protein [Actinokineospora sp.]